MNLFKNVDQKGRGADQYLAARINDATGKYERIGNAITNDDPVRQRGCASKTFNGLACAHVIDVAGFAPPTPGYCWCNTDLNRTQGFWDVCP
ncbi:MAG TPA: hypothetical protein VE111_03680 [Bradyrhizobium sp.]|nr:hypothetical protein [Bradyrhizobium sp.]